MSKPFFIHINPYQPGYPLWGKVCRGATVYVTPVSPEGKHRACYVQIAYCSPKDQFCRRSGREEALKKTPYRVFIKNLPEYLALAVGEHVYGWGDEKQFQFVWKHFL